MKPVENDCHVMFSCTLYDTLRNKFFDEIITKYNFFNDLDIKSKLLFLFNNIDPFICKSVAAFIFEIINCRHDHVISKWLIQLITIIYFFKRIGNARYVHGNTFINCCCCWDEPYNITSLQNLFIMRDSVNRGFAVRNPYVKNMP